MLVRFQPGLPNKKQAHVLIFCSEFLFSVRIAEGFVFFVDVGFAGVDVVVAGFDGGDVDREGAVEGCEATGAFLNG